MLLLHVYADHHLPQSSFNENSKQVTSITPRGRDAPHLFIEFKTYELLAGAARGIQNHICMLEMKYIEPISIRLRGDCKREREA